MFTIGHWRLKYFYRMPISLLRLILEQRSQSKQTPKQARKIDTPRTADDAAPTLFGFYTKVSGFRRESYTWRDIGNKIDPMYLLMDAKFYGRRICSLIHVWKEISAGYGWQTGGTGAVGSFLCGWKFAIPLPRRLPQGLGIGIAFDPLSITF